VAIKPAAPAGEAPKATAAPVAPQASKPSAPVAPLSVSAPYKETAKISLPSAGKAVPQATMNLKKPAAPAAPAAADKKAASAEAAETNVAPGKAGNSDLILGIAATVVALASLGIQLWTMLG
jgi:hypothetical protein